jgi:hypothetical protein
VALPLLDFSIESLRLVYLVRVEYAWSSRVYVERWAGPTSKTGAGVEADVDGEPALYRGRLLDDLEIERDLGGLDNAVQTSSSLSFSVALGEEDDGSGGFRERVQRGRWLGHKVDVWYARVDDRGRVVSAVHRFTGKVSRDPSEVTEIGFSFDAVETMILLDRRLPAGTWPASTMVSGWDHKDPCIIGPGGVEHRWHPGDQGVPGRAYAIAKPDRGKRVGFVFGKSYFDGAIWRETPYYGAQTDPFTPPNGEFLFFFVSPQFDCYVHELRWEKPSAGTVHGCTDATGPGVFCSSFNNYDPAFGPVGTCVSLTGAVPGLTDYFFLEPYPRMWARVSGPGAGSVYYTDEGGSVGIMQEDPLSEATSWDSEIVEHVIASPDMLDSPDALGSGAISDFHSLAPVGANSYGNYRKMASPIPETLGTPPPLVRDVLGELLRMVGADLVVRYDPASGEQRIFPIRRRPNPVQPDEDVIIHRHWLKDGSHSTIPSYVKESDPDRYYGNAFEATDAGDHRLLEVVTNLPGSLEPHRASFEVPVEQTEAGANEVVERDDDFSLWAPREEPDRYGATGLGFSDVTQRITSDRAQEQIVVKAVLGHYGFGLNLGTVVRFDLARLHVTEPGHVRRMLERPGFNECEIACYHVAFFEGVRSEGAGDPVQQAPAAPDGEAGEHLVSSTRVVQGVDSRTQARAEDAGAGRETQRRIITPTGVSDERERQS